MKFLEEVIWQVWSKGLISGNDPLFWRKDVYGAWILRSHYNKKESEYGWEIEYLEAINKDEKNTLNMIPINCRNKQDLVSECYITANGSNNIQILQKQ